MMSVNKFKEAVNDKLHGTSEVTGDSTVSQYEEVFAALGDEADEIIKMIDDIGAEETSKILSSNYHKPGLHQIVPKSENPEHSTYTSEDGTLIISWSPKSHEVKLLAKATNESCGAGTSVGGCGGVGGVALVKSRMGTTERRIGEGDEHEGMEDPTQNGVSGAESNSTDTAALPSWLDTEAVASAAHFMFKGHAANSLKDVVSKACKNCNTTEEAINKLREMANNKHEELSFNEKEINYLGEYRHKLRERLLGKSKGVIDQNSYLTRTVEAGGSAIGAGATAAASLGLGAARLGAATISSMPSINTSSSSMSADSSNKELDKANLAVEIAQLVAKLAAEKNPTVRAEIHKQLSKLEGQSSKFEGHRITGNRLTENAMVNFPNVYEWNAGKFPEKPNPGFDELQVLADALGVDKAAINIRHNLEDTIIGVTFPGMKYGVVIGKLVTRKHGSKIYLDEIQVVEDALAKNKKNKSKVSEGANLSYFKKNLSTHADKKDAIGILASKLGVNEMEFIISPFMSGSEDIGVSVVLEINGEKKKIADIVEGHNGWNINLNYIEFPEIENMLGSSVKKESVMTEKDDIDKKTIIGVLITAGPEKVSKAFATAANKSPDDFYKLINGIDVEGLKVLSRSVQGVAANNAEAGVKTSFDTPNDEPGNAASGGVAPGASANSSVPGTGDTLKDL